MNIGIIYGMGEKKIVGVSNAFIGIMQEILKMDLNNEYYSLYDNYYKLPMHIEKNIIKTNDFNENYDYYCFLHNIDILHSYWEAFYGIKSKCYKILTCYDLIPLVKKEWHPGLYDYFNESLRHSAQEADKIIAISEYTKKDLVNYYNLKPEKIEVIYLGNKEQKIDRKKEDNREKNIIPIEEEYILGVSSLVKYKNFDRMVEAFILFKERHRHSNLKLIITGKTAWDGLNKKSIVSYRNYEKDIIFTGYIDDYSLSLLYKNALAFVYVSLYEGFGLPILEAMGHGKAVVCSNTTSMPEVGGEAVEYCNPYEIDSIQQAIEKVVLNDVYRKELEQKAIIQSKHFSYHKAAEKTIEIYKNALKG